MIVPSFSWLEMGEAYQAFSSLSDEGDWQALMSQVSSLIASNATCNKNILDYGSGLGTTSASIRRRMYGDHGVLSSWCLYEPDAWARKASAFVMPPLGKHMDVVVNDSLPKGVFDTVLFVHTTYYVADFADVLNGLFEQSILTENGRVICVAMPESSPFFIDELQNRHYWTGDRISEAAKKFGLRCDVVKMRSRFRLLPSVEQDEELLTLITQFVVGKKNVSLDHVLCVKRCLSGETDFGDWVIVLQR